MRVLLVDDHPLFLEGLRNLLTARGLEVVGTAADGLEALAQVRTTHPDLVLMDIQMPRCDGLAGVKLIKSEFPQVRVVMLTVSASDSDLFEAIRSGAAGYLLKTQAAESFFHSLTELGQGQVALAPGLAQRIMDELVRARNEPLEDVTHKGQATDELSPRQTQVLSLVANGMTYREVGEQLGLTERTIKYHMGEILTALHLKNRSEAAAYARMWGITGRN